MDIVNNTKENGSELLSVNKELLLGTLDYQEEMARQWLRTINDVRDAINNRQK